MEAEKMAVKERANNIIAAVMDVQAAAEKYPAVVQQLEQIKRTAVILGGDEPAPCLDRLRGRYYEFLNSITRMVMAIDECKRRYRPTDDEMMRIGITAETLAYRGKRYFDLKNSSKKEA